MGHGVLYAKADAPDYGRRRIFEFPSSLPRSLCGQRPQSGVKGYYPFTAPAITPETMYFWQVR